MWLWDLISHVHLPGIDTSAFPSDTGNASGKHGLKWRLLPPKLLKKRYSSTLCECENVLVETLLSLAETRFPLHETGQNGMPSLKSLFLLKTAQKQIPVPELPPA